MSRFEGFSRRYLGGWPVWDGWGGKGMASGAAVITTSYGMNGNEQTVPTLVATATAAYCGNAVVFGAILARLSLFSEATFTFRSLVDGELSGAYEVDGRRNTALRKLENPWPNGTTGELLSRMIQDVDLSGNAYIWDAGDQLVRLRPDWVTIVSEIVQDPLGRDYRRVVGYWYDPPVTDTQAGRSMLLDVAEVAHWSPVPDPYANFRGMSWLTPVLREVSGDNAMTAYKIQYLTNAASPNLLIRYTQKLGPGVVQKIRDRITDTHSGVDNAFRTLVLDEGADVTVIGNTFEQMNFSTVQAAGENRIIIASGVPGIVIGSKEGLMAATYSNYEQAMRRFADITMRPLWRSACACLSKLVTVPTGQRLWFDTDEIAALRQGEKERADTILVQAQAASALVGAGFKPESVVAALDTGCFGAIKFDKKPAPPPITQGDAGLHSLLPPPPGAPVLNGTKPVATQPIGAVK